MTTPDERLRSIRLAGEFLRYVADYAEHYYGFPRVRIANGVRKIAKEVLRHYPQTEMEIEWLARSGRPNVEQLQSQIAELTKRCEKAEAAQKAPEAARFAAERTSHDP